MGSLGSQKGSFSGSSVARSISPCSNFSYCSRIRYTRLMNLALSHMKTCPVLALVTFTITTDTMPSVRDITGVMRVSNAIPRCIAPDRSLASVTRGMTCTSSSLSRARRFSSSLMLAQFTSMSSPCSLAISRWK